MELAAHLRVEAVAATQAALRGGRQAVLLSPSGPKTTLVLAVPVTCELAVSVIEFVLLNDLAVRLVVRVSSLPVRTVLGFTALPALRALAALVIAWLPSLRTLLAALIIRPPALCGRLAVRLGLPGLALLVGLNDRAVGIAGYVPTLRVGAVGRFGGVWSGAGRIGSTISSTSSTILGESRLARHRCEYQRKSAGSNRSSIHCHPSEKLGPRTSETETVIHAAVAMRFPGAVAHGCSADATRQRVLEILVSHVTDLLDRKELLVSGPRVPPEPPTPRC